MLFSWLQRAWLAIENRLLRKHRLRPVYNVNRCASQASQRKALLVYLAPPFHLSPSHPTFRQHQNQRQCIIIAEILGELGYVVDAVDVSDRTFRPTHTYDLVISHRVNHVGLEAAFSPKTVRIYFAAGLNHIEHNRKLAERVAYFEKRNGKGKLDQIAWQESEDMPFVSSANALIGFGNEYVMESWRSVVSGPCYGFDNYGECGHLNSARNWKEARRNFLFFGSRRQLAKGLDLLLETFAKMPDLHLHVCSKFRDEPEFCRFYEQELKNTPNIHAWGWVDIQSEVFRNIVSRSGYVIFPSCSEGSPGSITNAISAGLVPLVSRETGLDLNGCGRILEDSTIEHLMHTVRAAAAIEDWDLAAKSKAAAELAAKRWSKAAFRGRWLEILSEIHKRFVASAP